MRSLLSAVFISVLMVVPSRADPSPMLRSWSNNLRYQQYRQTLNSINRQAGGTNAGAILSTSSEQKDPMERVFHQRNSKFYIHGKFLRVERGLAILRDKISGNTIKVPLVQFSKQDKAWMLQQVKLRKRAHTTLQSER